MMPKPLNVSVENAPPMSEDLAPIKKPSNFHKAPPIKWGEAFDKMSEEQQINYLKQLASSMNHAADLLQKERNELAQRLNVEQQKNENAQKAVDIQKRVSADNITQSNQQIQELAQQLVDAQQQNRELAREVKNLRLQVEAER